MSAEWAARDEQPILPTSTNQKTLVATVNLSLIHFPPNNQVPMNPFCAKTFNLTIMWYHMATMALRGLNLPALPRSYQSRAGGQTAISNTVFCRKK